MERNLATSSSPPVNLGSIFFGDGGEGGGGGDAVVERALPDASLGDEEDQNQPIFVFVLRVLCRKGNYLGDWMDN